MAREPPCTLYVAMY